MSIEKRCMIVSLQVGLWLGHRFDKAASLQLTESANAEGDAARVNKLIVQKSAINPIGAAAQAARRHMYANTLPWRDNGDRLLTREMYVRFMDEQGAYAERFKAEVDNFLKKVYPGEIERASFRMGELFNADDYPKVAELRRRFYISLDILPVATANDFRVAIGKDEVARVKADMQATLDQRIQSAQQDIYRRLAELLDAYVTRIKHSDSFKGSTVDRLMEFVNIIPAMSLVDDPKLTALHTKIVKQLGGVTAADMRADDKLRRTTSTQAAKIMAEMRGFMKAFS